MTNKHAQAVDRLIQARLGTTFAVFADTPEGIRMPDGDEEESGRVIDSDGRVFSYWYGWDETRGAAALTEWSQVEPLDRWLHIPGYVRALKRVGRSVPPTSSRPLPSGA